jgi:hypothetical protein
MHAFGADPPEPPSVADPPVAEEPPAGAPEEPWLPIERETSFPPHSTSPASRSPDQPTPSPNCQRPISRILKPYHRPDRRTRDAAQLERVGIEASTVDAHSQAGAMPRCPARFARPCR